jgi:hypothetical protein
MNKYLFLLFSFLVTSFCVFCLTAGSVLTWGDIDYVNSLNLPPEADSVSIPIAGAVIAGMELILFNILFHVIILIICVVEKDLRKIDIFDFLPRKEERFMNLTRHLSFAGLSLLLMNDIIFYRFINYKVFAFNILFYISLVVSVFVVLIWINTLLADKCPEKKIGRHRENKL